jgi:hypothetical protein
MLFIGSYCSFFFGCILPLKIEKKLADWVRSFLVELPFPKALQAEERT